MTIDGELDLVVVGHYSLVDLLVKGRKVVCIGDGFPRISFRVR